MESMLSPDRGIYKWMSWFTNLVLLNVLWIMCCIPVITAGASTSAMYCILLKMVREEESYIVRGFFRAFAQNFRQATIIWLLTLAWAGLILAETVFCIHATDPNAKWMAVPIIMSAFIGGITAAYIFPVISFFDDSITAAFKNAFLMAAGHLPETFVIVIVNCIPVFILWFFSGFMVIATFTDLIIGFSFCAWLNARRFRRIFDRYLPDREAGYTAAGQ